MKLLEINVCSGCKSTGRIASDIAKEFVAMGNEAMIAYGRGFLDCGIQTYKISSKNEVTLNSLTRIKRFFLRNVFTTTSKKELQGEFNHFHLSPHTNR